MLTLGACSLVSASDAELMGGKTPIMQAGGEGASPAPSTGGSSSSLAGEASVIPGAGGGGAAEPGPSTGGSSDGGDAAVGGAPALAEAPIPRDGLVLWLTTEQGIGMAEGGVAEWNDQSGQGHVARAIAGQRPKLVTVLALEQDMIELDGVDDMLALDEGFADFSNGLTAFVVAVALDDRECSSVLQLSNAAESQDIDLGRQQGSIHYEVAGPSVTGIANAFALNQTVVLSVIHGPTALADLRINSVHQGSDELGLPEVMVRQNNFIGRSLYSGCGFFKGRIGEILLYNRPFTLDERKQVEAYLDGKWDYTPSVKPKPNPDPVAAK